MDLHLYNLSFIQGGEIMYRDIVIYAYNTHYELVNYDMGDCKGLENKLSVYDEVYHKRNYYSHYDEEERILYVPRGIDSHKLQELTGKPIMGFRDTPSNYEKISFSMKYLPRNDVQKEAVRFLLSKGDFQYTKGASQLILALIGGGGKTYCSVAAMSILEMKSLVVCHTGDLMNQWISRLLEYTTIPESYIIKLSSYKQLLEYLNPTREVLKRKCTEYVYIISHSLIHNFMAKEGMKATYTLLNNMGIGLKIIDEFHRNFMNTLMLDYSTNVKKTIYLSATPSRTDRVEDAVFQLAFNRVYKLKRDTNDFGDVANTYAIYDIFETRPLEVDLIRMTVGKKFNIHRYMDYELSEGVILERMLFWLDWLYKRPNMDTGAIFVLSPSKESCKITSQIISETYPDKKVTAHFTGNKVDNIGEYDVVCGTVKMLGTGTDIDNLRAMIVLEPIGSEVNADQLIHRLMRGKTQDITYNIELIDRAVSNVYRMYLRRKKVYSKFVKKNIVYNQKLVERYKGV